MRRKHTPDFQLLCTALVKNGSAARAEFYRAEVFGGPSLHFHREALAAAEHDDSAMFATTSYAVLASWGMHRMGPGGSKMREFAPFARSIADIWPTIRDLREVQDPSELDPSAWKALEGAFKRIDAMASETRLVGNSKVLAHALPRLVAPIDRQYTLNYVYGSTAIKNDLAGEWERFRTLHTELFHAIHARRDFAQLWTKWQREARSWDTSSLKAIDNIVIGSVRLARSSTPVAV